MARKPFLPPRFALCFVCTLVTAALAMVLAAQTGMLAA